MANRKYNPEKSAWSGRSHRKGGTRVRTLREKEQPKGEFYVELDEETGCFGVFHTEMSACFATYSAK